ncbi:MAG: hypothetical protein ISS25_01880 [Nanoarchaeota archaeon]|nr:hypothetical protein [DPANN group archaeon]MBL7116555.1 hypothetical protein [Nanoarchaeota archaeon]
MLSVKIENNKCIINFNKRLYPKSIIEQGIIDFKEDEKIILTERGKVIITSNKKTNINEVGYEFCDYLLSLIQERNNF